MVRVSLPALLEKAGMTEDLLIKSFSVRVSVQLFGLAILFRFVFGLLDQATAMYQP